MKRPSSYNDEISQSELAQSQQSCAHHAHKPAYGRCKHQRQDYLLCSPAQILIVTNVVTEQDILVLPLSCVYLPSNLFESTRTIL
jgi:hypothetical protein